MKSNDALYRYNEIKRAIAAAAEPSRAFPGCPPNRGNDNETPVENRLESGDIKSVAAAGVSKVRGGQ